MGHPEGTIHVLPNTFGDLKHDFRPVLTHERPGFGARMRARVINLLPEIGTQKKFAFTLPDQPGEQPFRCSFADALAEL